MVDGEVEMVSFEEIQTVYYMVAATGVLIAAVFYILNLMISQRNQEIMLKAQEHTLETRQAQLLMSVLNRWTETEYNKKWQTTLWNMSWSDYDDKMKRYPWGSLELIEEGTLWNYFESIAVLVEVGLIDIKILSKLVAGDLIQFWEKFGPPMIEMRKRRGLSALYIHTEYLYNELKKISPSDWRYKPHQPF